MAGPSSEAEASFLGVFPIQVQPAPDPAVGGQQCWVGCER